MDIQQLTKIPAKHWMLAFSFYMGFACSGVLVLMRFRPDLVHDFDILKLILVGSALIMPAFTWNCIALLPLVVFTNLTPNPEEDAIIIGPILTLSAMASFATVNTSLVLSYIFMLSFRGFFWLAIVTQLVFTIWSFTKRNQFKKGTVK